MKKAQLQEFIKLSQNENPLGPSPNVLAAIREASNDAHRYPEPHSRSLSAKLADSLSVDPGNVFVSAGLVESLDIVIRNFVGDGGNMIIGEITFVAYRLISEVYGVATRFSTLKDYRMDIDNILSCYDENTKLIIIANPNNPTGTTISEYELIRLMDQVSSETYVVIDEAYREYVTQQDYPASLKLQIRYPNLIVMRTFSKIYGLAGLRVGYSIASKEIVERLVHYQAPFTVNCLASVAATAALDDQVYIDKCSELNNESRILLTKELTNLGLRVTPSQGNFLFLTFPSVEERDRIYDLLGRLRIQVRKTDMFGADHSFRLTIGESADNARIISEMKSRL